MKTSTLGKPPLPGETIVRFNQKAVINDLVEIDGHVFAEVSPPFVVDGRVISRVVV